MTGIPDEAVVAFNWAATEWSTYCDDAVRAGLAAALPHLAATVRAQVAEEIATALEAQAAVWRSVDLPNTTGLHGSIVAYDHAAAIARQLRVPDCGDQYHGADGGPCSGCGFDAAALADALTASQPDRGTSDRDAP